MQRAGRATENKAYSRGPTGCRVSAHPQGQALRIVTVRPDRQKGT